MAKFYTHPRYKEREQYWKLADALHAGKHDILIAPEYLWMHEFEHSTAKGGDILRAIRQQRSRYTNHMKTIIRRYCGLLFKEMPDFSEVEPLLGDALNNIDGNGTTLYNFIKDVIAPNWFIYGKAAISVDTPDVEVRTRAEEIALGIRPFFESLNPMQIKDWQSRTIGTQQGQQVDWLRYEFGRMADRLSPSEQPSSRIMSKIWRVDGSGYVIELWQGPEIKAGVAYVADSEWTNIKNIPVTGSPIPLAVIEGESWLDDVAQKALQLYNLESSLDNQLNYQAFQRIFATGMKAGDAQIVNEAGIVLLPEGAGVQSIEPSNPTSLMNRINGVAASMFQIAFAQTRILPSDAKSIEGAETQRETKEDLIACLVAASATIESCVNQAIQHYAELSGKGGFDGEVKFDKDISVEDVEQVIALNAQYLDEIKKYPTWYKSAMKSIADYGNYPNIEEIHEEIDAGPVQTAQAPEQQDALKAALNGSEGTQPEADPTV